MESEIKAFVIDLIQNDIYREEEMNKYEAEMVLNACRSAGMTVPRPLRTAVALANNYNEYMRQKNNGEFLCEKDALRYCKETHGEESFVIPLKTNMNSGEYAWIDFEGDVCAPEGNGDTFELYEMRSNEDVCLGYVWIRQSDKETFEF